MANFLINAGGLLATIIVPLAELAAEQHGATTSFSIGIGGNATGDFNAEGSVPHVAFWDVKGARIAQYKGDANGHLDQNFDWTMSISNDQTEPRGAARQPEYISVVAEETDAICISYIYASGNGAQYAWYGDMGYTCGADWHYSNFTVGDGHYQPKCVWIDQDHSNGLRFQGLSFHFPDFTASQTGQMDEYNTNLDTLCKSDPRMKFWPGIVPDAVIPFFTPPLQYNTDGSDVDPSLVINKSPKKNMINIKTKSSRSNQPKQGGRQLRPDHLIVSHFEGHSAKELCESATSIGPDFVSMNEKIFCDMATKQWWNLCSPTLATGCFDVNKQTIVGNAAVHQGNQATVHSTDTTTGRVIPVKSYKTSVTWG
jgi:hypothetical protein